MLADPLWMCEGSEYDDDVDDNGGFDWTEMMEGLT